jgi:hypothetical protein
MCCLDDLVRDLVFIILWGCGLEVGVLWFIPRLVPSLPWLLAVMSWLFIES